MASSSSSSSATTAYPLDNSALSAEIQRLEWQHYNLLVPMLGPALLPPAVLAAVQAQPAPAVADVGTGTGVWLVDLAPQLPAAARLDGFDINMAKFRPAAALPPNVRLTYGDAMAAVEGDAVGKYDVVHVRLLFLALQQPADWQRVAAHAHALLRPGGWLVWEEIDLRASAATPAASETARTLTAVLARLMAERAVDPATDEWYPRDLGKLLGESGFAAITQQTYALADRTDDAALTRAGNSAMRLVLHAYLYGVLAAGGVEGLRSEADVAARLAVISRELDSGAATTTHSHVRVVGQKE